MVFWNPLSHIGKQQNNNDTGDEEHILETNKKLRFAQTRADLLCAPLTRSTLNNLMEKFPTGAKDFYKPLSLLPRPVQQTKV